MPLMGEDKAQWRKANRERIYANRKLWLVTPAGKAHRARQAAKAKERYQATRGPKRPKMTREQLAANMAARSKLRRDKARADGIAALGGCCCACGISDSRVLEFDHRKPLRRRSNGVRSKGYGELKRAIADGTVAIIFQLMCANCHAIKTRDVDGWAKRP